MQIFYANHLVNIEDFTAMMDTLGNVSNVSAVLLIATIVLNIITYMVCTVIITTKLLYMKGYKFMNYKHITTNER